MAVPIGTQVRVITNYASGGHYLKQGSFAIAGEANKHYQLFTGVDFKDGTELVQGLNESDYEVISE